MGARISRFLDIARFTYKALDYKFEQRKLITHIHATIKTKMGPVKGVQRLAICGGSYYSFEGIPYAKPPLGELRFRAPVPADPWEDVLDCTGPAEKPLQTDYMFRKSKGSEDCLYLNVYTNNITPEKPRPVMVWIYGGGFQIGEATRDLYSPDFFMTKDIVLVTVAYRLGAFGFLSIDDPSVNIPGNAGIKDQILGLRWVQENISYFGGDPNNVTLFGESAGGASTHLCLLSDHCKNLVQKSIIMSGSILCPWARPPKSNWAYRLAKKLGYEGDEKGSEIYKFLRNASGADLLSATSTILKKEEKHHRVWFAFGPVIEPYITEECVLSAEPRQLMTTTWSNHIPLMIGGNSFEGLLLYPEVIRRPATLNEVGNCKNLLPIDLGLQRDTNEVEECALTLKKTYFGDEKCSPQTIMKFLDLESYREFWHPIYRTVRIRIEHSTAPTYVYRFDYDSKDGNAIRNIVCGRNMRGVCHGDELCYMYNAIFTQRYTQNSMEEYVTRTMIDIWTSFAATGDPNCTMLADVKFEPVSRDAENVKCLNISDRMEFIELPELQKLKIWDNLYPRGKL